VLFLALLRSVGPSDTRLLPDAATLRSEQRFSMLTTPKVAFHSPEVTHGEA
jgi:hypothetical protein